MSVRCFGFLLLAWLPGALHAIPAAQPCSPPSLDGGYAVPVRDTYPHESTLAYGCDKGRKPTAEGWWAKITCENGRWSPNPQCIDEKACLPPTVSNGEYIGNPNGWYVDGSTIQITCDEGYEDKGNNDRATCVNGNWRSLPVCETKVNACSEPPKIPHAVIIRQQHQEVFAAGSKLQYECENTFTTEEANAIKSISCVRGNWTAGPPCNRIIREGGGHVGFCTMNSADYPELIHFGVKYILEGEEQEKLECVKLPKWWTDHYSLVQCTDGELQVTKCCGLWDRTRGACDD